MNIKLSDNDKKMLKKFGRFEHTCARCGKEFECGAEYVYKRGGMKSSASIYFCSWTCFREDEKEQESKKIYNRRAI